MRVLDLFCGAGGASTGLAATGCDVIGFDIDADACRSHQLNGHPMIRCDLNVYGWRGTCDLLWASPPCQPFSSAGDRRGAEDARDGMPAFLRAVDALRPPVVVMENVPGLTNKKHLVYRGMFTTALLRMGYDYQWRILNCADYGVPQTRERFILIARRDGQRIRWPQRTHNETGAGARRWVTMGEALGLTEGRVGFPRKDDRGDSPDGYRVRDVRDVREPSFHVTGKARSWTLNTGRDWKPGGTRDDAQTIDPQSAPAPAFSAKAGGQWHLHRPATTVAGDSRVHPPGHKENSGDPPGKYPQRRGADAIRITVDQAATLQGFPPGYRFVGSKTSQFQQIGNAVPPALAKAIVAAL